MRRFETKRLFIAIEIPPEIKSALLAPAKPCGIKGVKWLPPEQVHLTLRFIGDIPSEAAQAVRSALERLRPWSPFELTVEGCGFFPSERRPNVFWAGVKAPESLAALKESVDLALMDAGVEPEGRPFRPHVTVARLKDGFRRESCPELAACLSSFKPASFRVGSLSLFSSALMPSGASHTREAAYGSSAP